VSIIVPTGHECASAVSALQPSSPSSAGDWPQQLDYLQAALTFRHFGWSVIPMNGKDPVGRWKWWQNHRMWDQRLGVAFRWRPPVTGLAVILGKVSGWLACRDFDSREVYLNWARKHPDLAVACPTALTWRGAHVYFRNRDKIERFCKWADGELRANCRHYVVLPPSEHPRGGHYRWCSPEPVGPSAFPWLRLGETGFIDGDHPISARSCRNTQKRPRPSTNTSQPQETSHHLNTATNTYPPKPLL
jgi:hypothetical protein